MSSNRELTWMSWLSVTFSKVWNKKINPNHIYLYTDISYQISNSLLRWNMLTDHYRSLYSRTEIILLENLFCVGALRNLSNELNQMLQRFFIQRPKSECNQYYLWTFKMLHFSKCVNQTYGIRCNSFVMNFRKLRTSESRRMLPPSSSIRLILHA